MSNRNIKVVVTIFVCAVTLLLGVLWLGRSPSENHLRPTEGFEERLLGDEPYLIHCTPNPKRLVVVLHTWSGDYKQAQGWFKDLQNIEHACLVAPNYNGPNDHPSACASPDALARVQKIILFFQKFPELKSTSILGASGGGYMAFMVLGTYPNLVDSASIWIPIYDLAAWYDEIGKLQPEHQKDLIGCFGHAPKSRKDPDYLRRSPLSVLDNVHGAKQIIINTGRYDGLAAYKGSVPPYHGRLAADQIRRACPQCHVEYIEFNGAHDFRVDEAVRQVNTF